MDPNLQVAFVSVLATLITTSGVVAVAFISNRRDKKDADDSEVEDGLDERDVLERLFILISENERKENTITRLRRQVEFLRQENGQLKVDISALVVTEIGSTFEDVLDLPLEELNGRQDHDPGAEQQAL